MSGDGNQNGFEDAACAYYEALMDDPETPMPEWMQVIGNGGAA